MREQDTSNLVPGMRLARDVKDASGMVMVKEGTVLSDGIIAGLKRRGVSSVMVEASDDKTGAAMDTAELKDKILEQMEILRPLFSRCSNMEWMASLMKAAASARARRH